jgi:molybdate transport system regulatory protein
MPRIHPGPRNFRSKGTSDDAAIGWEGRLRLWVDIDGRPALGPGKVRLLDAIADTHSLAAAAKKLGMSYRLAWKHLKLIEERTGFPVVDRQRGGKTGGGTDLTPKGRVLLKAYHNFHKEIEHHVQDACQQHFAQWTNT